MWRPKEIIIHETVKSDPITKYFLGQCPGVPVKYVGAGKSKDIIASSDILKNSGLSMLDKILAGKQVVAVTHKEDRWAVQIHPGLQRWATIYQGIAQRLHQE